MEPIPGISEDQLQEIHDAFYQLDPLGTGRITGKLMGQAMRTLGQSPTEAELYDMIDEIDMDGDGEVDFAEFQAMIIKKMESYTKEESLMAAFKLFDRDEDGYISQVDLRNVMFNLGERCSEEEFNDMFREIDTDNDGRISYHEFVQGVKN